MSDLLESGSFPLPSEVKSDVAGRLKDVHSVKSVELQMKGDDLEKTADFAKLLKSLKRSGVKVSCEFSFRLDFPRAISKQKTLTILENMPKPVNGSLKAKVHLNIAQSATV